MHTSHSLSVCLRLSPPGPVTQCCAAHGSFFQCCPAHLLKLPRLHLLSRLLMTCVPLLCCCSLVQLVVHTCSRQATFWRHSMSLLTRSYTSSLDVMHSCLPTASSWNALACLWVSLSGLCVCQAEQADEHHLLPTACNLRTSGNAAWNCTPCSIYVYDIVSMTELSQLS